MDYILIPSKSKSETTFYLDLLRRMKKQATTVSEKEMEDIAFVAALKEAELGSKGSLKKVKAHLKKISTGR